jgi:coproporphyrinogen III oxidase-like Fe-S oxidoreductase
LYKKLLQKMDSNKLEKIKKHIEERKGMYIFCAQTCTYLKVDSPEFWSKVKEYFEHLEENNHYE